MAEKIHDSKNSAIEMRDIENNEKEKIEFARLQSSYSEMPEENLTIFTCLIDMIALEEGVFGSGTSNSRIARAHRNLQNGLHLKDGSIFRYTHASGPSLNNKKQEK